MKSHIIHSQDNQSSELTKLKGNRLYTDEYLRQISQFLANTAQDIVTNQPVAEITVNLLKQVARARVAITATCKLLSDIYLVENPDIDEPSRSKLEEFFPLLANFTNNPPNTDVHLFIQRQIIFEHGNREMAELVRRSQYGWLELQTDQANQPVG